MKRNSVHVVKARAAAFAEFGSCGLLLSSSSLWLLLFSNTLSSHTFSSPVKSFIKMSHHRLCSVRVRGNQCRGSLRKL